MTKKRSLTVLVVVLTAAVVITGGLMASNMGFKLNRALTATGEGPSGSESQSGIHTLGLPYNRQVGIDLASDLFTDSGKFNNIQKYDSLADAFVPYTFGSPVDWPLEAGQGLFVDMGLTDNYIVVGSHDPSATIQLKGPVAGSSGSNLYAPPYHGTAAMASQLFVEIGNVNNLQAWDTTGDAFIPYTFGTGDYPINPGEAYFVVMAAPVAYSPSHY